MVGLRERHEVVGAAPSRKRPCVVGSTTPHFISLPGVTTENWLAATAAHAGVLRSCGMIALPTRRPIAAARSRSELLAGFGVRRLGGRGRSGRCAGRAAEDPGNARGARGTGRQYTTAFHVHVFASQSVRNLSTTIPKSFEHISG